MCCGKPQPMSGSEQYEIVPHCKFRGHAYVHVAQGILSGTVKCMEEHIVNPQCARAERVTVVCWPHTCVSVCVYLLPR